MSSEPVQPGQAQGAEATGRDRNDPVPLADPLAMRALAHPVRLALIELLAVLDTVTATQASELLGESPANCAFHLRTLAKYGFVEEAGGGRGRERPWKAADRDISITSVHADPQAALAADALGRFWLEQ
jgi:predicted ArsR family transcriptional regulator